MMKVTLAVLVALVSVVSCSYRGPGMRPLRPPMKEARAFEGWFNTCEDFEWPWAIMEFSQFVGRCHTSQLWYEQMDLPFPTEGVLAFGCPYAYNVSEMIMTAPMEERPRIEELFERVFPLVQCANLMAENETMMYFAEYFSVDIYTNTYFMEARPLFDICTRMFGEKRMEVEEYVNELYQIWYEWTYPAKRAFSMDIKQALNKLAQRKIRQS